MLSGCTQELARVNVFYEHERLLTSQIIGKGESIWDHYFHHHPEVVEDGRNGDIASDSYNLYQRDVEMLRELGVDHYRFSIAWSRILPTGLVNDVNEKGVQYYENLIEKLLKYNIEPVVTLYHMDLPQYLQDMGGWVNPLSVDWFEDYARIIFDKFANRVKYWVTINQPCNICIDGYGSTHVAPALGKSGVADYVCMKNILLAHAKAYRLYEKDYKSKYNGLVGIALFMSWADAVNNKTENMEAVDTYREFRLGMYMDPIWSTDGDFPKKVKDIVAKKSREQGFSRSRLPELTAKEKKLVKGSADFLGVNHYTTFLVERSKKQHPTPSFADDVNVDISHDKNWKVSKSSWLASVPYGLYRICLYINLKYNYPKMFITEHGWSTGPGLGDQSRVDNMSKYMNALLIALEDGTDLIGYTAWSLMDNVEWTAGTSERFGLYEVNFESDAKTRTARLSAFFYKHLIEKRTVDENFKPASLIMEISDMKRKER
ncbi:hypothetical protein ACJJTC_014153 [Scirpophaga incertulas]